MSEPTVQRLRYAMIGGGSGSFIGAVHRKAAALDGRTDLVAGALSSSPERSLQSCKEIGLPADRSYGSWQDLLEKEQSREEHERIHFVSIVTPNDSHFEIAKAALEAGFHVIIDKPMVHTSEQANELVRVARAQNRLICVTYNYTGYPMIKQAAHMVRNGTLGELRKVFVDYRQGWLAAKLEESGMKQAAWRTDPAKAGLGGAVGDIGSHAENLLSTITGLDLESLSADVTSFVPGRQLDDDVSVFLRFEGGAKGLLTCSQVCVGEDNNLTIQIYGTEGGLRWRQEEPNELIYMPRDGARQVLTRNGPGLCESATRAARLPAGHPEAFIEAFANVYIGMTEAIRAQQAGTSPDGLGAEIPTGADGARGVHFIEKVVESGRSDAAWVDARWTIPE